MRMSIFRRQLMLLSQQRANCIIPGKTIIVTATSTPITLTINGVKSTYKVKRNYPSKIKIKEQKTSMADLMAYSKAVTEVDLSNYDTTGVTDMRAMFYDATALKKANLSGLDGSQVKYIASCFEGCSALTDVDMSGFDFGNVATYGWGSIFNNCSSLKSLKFGQNLKQSLDLHWSPLTHDAALSVIHGLAVVPTLQSVIFKGSTYNMLTPDEIGIATSKGWDIVNIDHPGVPQNPDPYDGDDWD